MDDEMLAGLLRSLAEEQPPADDAAVERFRADCRRMGSDPAERARIQAIIEEAGLAEQNSSRSVMPLS